MISSSSSSESSESLLPVSSIKNCQAPPARLVTACNRGFLIVGKYEEKYHLDCNLGELGGV